ncbi:hypothetical protein Efla_001715 [Eimeria flavescens]
MITYTADRSLVGHVPPSFVSIRGQSCSELQLQYWCLPSPLVRRVATERKQVAFDSKACRCLSSADRAYASLGVTSLYPWQAHCLQLALSKKGASREDEPSWRSLVYCAPTSGGKSLVAEVILARRLLFEGVRSLVVVPHVSLCAERVQHLRQLLSPLALRVEAFHAGANAASNWYAGVDVAICTLEKANLIINRLVQDSLIPQVATAQEAGEPPQDYADSKRQRASIAPCCKDDSADWARDCWEILRSRLPSVAGELPVGLVCVDEIHFVGDPQRGHLLEMLLAKLVFINQVLQRPVQLIGMSATLPNVKQVATWLGAEAFLTDVRPSPLDMFVKVGPQVFAWNTGVGLQPVRRLHDGHLRLPSVADAATRAAARSLTAAACASIAAASGSGLAATQQQTASGTPGTKGCASLAAGALRFLRTQFDNMAHCASIGRDESKPTPADNAVPSAEAQAGWQADAEHLGALTWEVLREGRRVLVFCPTQEWTARTAGFLAKALPFYRRAEAWADLLRQRAAVYLESHRQGVTAGADTPERRPQEMPRCLQEQQEQQKQRERQQHAVRQARKELLALPPGVLAQLLVQSPHLYVEPHIVQGREELQWQLRQLARLPPATMLAAVREGVAYHHAGLSGDERECVEAGYRRGHLNVLCATSTLALGVNLPAARVIIRAPHVGRDEFLSPGRFHQMAGRAGRKGLESRGDAYLMCTPATLPKVQTLLSAVCAADSAKASPSRVAMADADSVVTSRLKGQRLCRFILEAVHILLPLLRPARVDSAKTRIGAFFDVAAILLRCTLRGQQLDDSLTLVEEAAECARYLHTFFLLEAEPGYSASASLKSEYAGRNKSIFCLTGSGASTVRPFSGDVKAEAEPPASLGQDSAGAPTMQTPSLHSLAFPTSPLPPTCRLMLQQYPCLRSPVVLARMLQGAEFDSRPLSESLTRFAASVSPIKSPSTVTSGVAGISGSSAHLTASAAALRSGGHLSQRARMTAAAVEEQESFASSVRLYFRGLFALADQLSGGPQTPLSAMSDAPRCLKGRWDDLRGRLATTDAGAAAVEAGLAPWEAAELFADFFKTSVLGLCAATELHLIFLAAVAIGGDTQPHWRSYLAVYDKLDPASRRVADTLGIQRQVICSEAIKAQGATRRFTSDMPDLLLANALTFDQLRERVKIETHRRFYFALLLFNVYREGEAYEAVFGVTKNALITCTSQGALVCATVAAFLRSLRPQEAALSEVCFMLAGKLKLACLPMGVVASTLAVPQSSHGALNHSVVENGGSQTTAAFQQLLQLEGMTPRRAVALRAAQINSCADLANAHLLDVYKALEAAEPSPFAPVELSSEEKKTAWTYRVHRQRARLLAVTVKLKDAAQQDQAMRLQCERPFTPTSAPLLGQTPHLGPLAKSVSVSTGIQVA